MEKMMKPRSSTIRRRVLRCGSGGGVGFAGLPTWMLTPALERCHRFRSTRWRR
jgi:hypothetical protein